MLSWAVIDIFVQENDAFQVLLTNIKISLSKHGLKS